MVLLKYSYNWFDVDAFVDAFVGWFYNWFDDDAVVEWFDDCVNFC